MKRSSSLLSLVLLLSLLLMLTTFVVAGASAPDDGPWVYSTDLPAVAVRSDTEFYNGKMYMLGYRTDSAGTTDGSVWMFDAALNTWSDTGVDMPVPVSNYTIAKLTDSTGVGLYIFGGRDSQVRARRPSRCTIPPPTRRRQSPPIPGREGQRRDGLPRRCCRSKQQGLRLGWFLRRHHLPLHGQPNVDFRPGSRGRQPLDRRTRPAGSRSLPEWSRPRRQGLFHRRRYLRRGRPDRLRRRFDAGSGQPGRRLADKGPHSNAVVGRAGLRRVARVWLRHGFGLVPGRQNRVGRLWAMGPNSNHAARQFCV